MPKFSKNLSYLIISLSFIYAFIYCFRADLVFAKNDTRYRSTEWILKNVPEDSTIEHYQDMDWLFSSKIVFRNPVIFYGRNSRTFKNGSFYQLKDAQDVNLEEYIKKLRDDGPQSDYFIMAIGSGAEYDSDIFDKFTHGRFPYKLVRKFEYNRSLYWNPRPTYTCPTIHIYKRF